MFPRICESLGIPVPVPEFRFHPTRMFRFDFAWPEKKIALEVEGGIWINGRHNRGSGFVRDLEKYNSAAALGWRVVRCTPKEIYSQATAKMVAEVLKT